MSLDNFSLLSSIWGATAVITHVEFQETRRNDRSCWRALIVARDGQMLFSTITGTPRSWTTLGRAYQEMSSAVPPGVEMRVVGVRARAYKLALGE